MDKKICRICGIEKDIDLFRLRNDAKDGHRSECKKCRSEIDKESYDNHRSERKIRYKQYYEKAKEFIKKQSREYKEGHKEFYKVYLREYYTKNKDFLRVRNEKYRNEHKSAIQEIRKRWNRVHKDEMREWQCEYRKTHKNERNVKDKKYRDSHPCVKIAIYLRNRIYLVLHGDIKYYKLKDVLGCDLDFLRKYIESLWVDNMDWSNYGKYGWHIDHIRPCASFDLSDIEQQKQCFHYTNLQPLWAKDNLSKNSYYNGEVYKFKRT